MATHNLAIAKASLAAGLMRSDPLPVSKEALKRFHELLDEVLEKCSPDNIQRCKEWLLSNQVLSTARAGVLGKYLVALSSNLKTQDKKRASSIRRQHLSILYLLNDLLHHLRYHEANQSRYQGFVEGVYRSLLDLLGRAAVFEEKLFPRHKARIARVLEEWSTHRYFKSNLQQELEQTANKAALSGTIGATDSEELVKREEPYIMPAVHGDPLAPYHELPAASLMPHIIPNTSIPIDPHHVRALQFSRGPAEPALVEVVKSFLKDIDLLYGTMIPEDEGISMELDDLGQKIIRDKQSGMVLSTETYYGWSKEFCENMKHKQSNQHRSQSRDDNSSRGRNSQSPRKRMRYGSRDRSGSRQRNRSESYSRSRSSSKSRSRSRSPPRQGMGSRRLRSQSPPYPRSPSRARPDSKPQSRPFQRSAKPFMSGSQPHPSPVTKTSTHQDHTSHNRPLISTQPVSFPQQPYLPMQQLQQHIPPAPPVAYGNNYHHSIPAPPPRPVNWQGPWPPPPPPPLPPGSMPAGQSYGQYQPQYQSGQQYSYGSHANAWSGGPSTSQLPLPPPPPPQPGNSHNGHTQHYNGSGTQNNQHGTGRGGSRW